MHGTVKNLYNGNISETFWRSSSDNIKRKYGYSYDNLNRLLNAQYQKPDSNTLPTNSYNESLSYDKNGNITSLLRNGEWDDDVNVIEIDNLDYTYENNSNRLSIVHDNSLDPNGFKDDSDVDPFDQDADYDYDDNGNMKSDANKGITSIVYNHLNLPTEINFGTTGRITYLYDATGKKLRKRVHVNNGTTDVTTSYLDGFQYKNDIIQFFPTAEGYANRLNSVYDSGNYFQVPKGEPDLFSYVYNYTDHIGNIRLSYTKEKGTNVLKIVEENHYYPFGLKHNNYNSSKMLYAKEGQMEKQKPLPPYMAMSYNYKYNGKEYQDELGLNMYDYGARNYDPAIGRWMNIDPLANKYYDLSPYNYVANNPILFIDPDGKEIIVANKNDQKAILKDINSRALGTFAFNKSGSLYLKSSKGNEDKYSKYYQERLVQAINDPKKIEIVKANEAPLYKVSDDGVTLVESGSSTKADVDENGGGITTPHVGTDQKVFVSGNVPENVVNEAKDTEGKPLKVESADILMHELVGHAIPHLVGTDTGNAVSNENKVHEQRNAPQRAAEPNHLESKKKIKKSN